MAEYIFKKMLDGELKKNNFEIISRGTAASDLYKIPRIVSETLMAQESIVVSNHISTQIDKNDFDTADMILVMERHHKEILRALFGDSPKVSLLGGNDEIPDPIGSPDEIYKETFHTIKKHLEYLKKNLIPQMLNSRDGKETTNDVSY